MVVLMGMPCWPSQRVAGHERSTWGLLPERHRRRTGRVECMLLISWEKLCCSPVLLITTQLFSSSEKLRSSLSPGWLLCSSGSSVLCLCLQSCFQILQPFPADFPALAPVLGLSSVDPSVFPVDSLASWNLHETLLWAPGLWLDSCKTLGFRASARLSESPAGRPISWTLLHLTFWVNVIR